MLVALAALAILAIPGSLFLFGQAMLAFHEVSLEHIKATQTIGGEPISLIREKMDKEVSAMREQREHESKLIEAAKQRKLSAIQD